LEYYSTISIDFNVLPQDAEGMRITLFTKIKNFASIQVDVSVASLG